VQAELTCASASLTTLPPVPKWNWPFFLLLFLLGLTRFPVAISLGHKRILSGDARRADALHPPRCLNKLFVVPWPVALSADEPGLVADLGPLAEAKPDDL
jgi:hypothetical protein